jgi:hypothetical protein
MHSSNSRNSTKNSKTNVKTVLEHEKKDRKIRKITTKDERSYQDNICSELHSWLFFSFVQEESLRKTIDRMTNCVSGYLENNDLGD